MLTIRLFSILFILIGLILSFQTVCDKINISTGIGWLISAVGMFLLSFCEFFAGSLIYAIISLIFAMVNIYFCVNDFK